MSHPFRRFPPRAVRALIVALLATAGTAAVLAQSRPAARGFIWSIERDGRTSWLVGSLHVLTQDAYPLPAAMDQAFGRAKTLIEETDVNDISSPEILGVVASRGMFTNGQTLETVLPAASYTQLAQRMGATGLPIDMVKLMRPWMVELTLSGLELQRAGFDPELGIDVHYRRLAAQNGMALSMLETAAEQIDYLAGLPLDLQVAQLQKTLEDGDTELKEVREIAAAVARGRRGGDRAADAQGDEGLTRLLPDVGRRSQSAVDSAHRVVPLRRLLFCGRRRRAHGGKRRPDRDAAAEGLSDYATVGGRW
jgi:uncharacterized protein YbaP (TraB family)